MMTETVRLEAMFPVSTLTTGVVPSHSQTVQVLVTVVSECDFPPHTHFLVCLEP